MKSRDNWTPGPILPPQQPRSVPVSIRMPKDLYDELGLYAKRVGAQRTYLILECLRRLLAAKVMGGPPRTAAKARGRTTPSRRRR
jgi:hypothetical protein